MQMAPFSTEARERHAEQLLHDLGIERVRVEAVGHQSEIAALSAPAAEFERLLGEEALVLAAELRVLGFRYVALDLEEVEDDSRQEGGIG